MGWAGGGGCGRGGDSGTMVLARLWGCWMWVCCWELEMSETVLDETVVLEVLTDTACSDWSGRVAHRDESHTDRLLHMPPLI